MRTLQVQNEFGALRTALVHDASNAVDTTLEELRRLIPPDELADHPESGTSLRDQIISQHAAFRRVLAEHGVSLISPETQEGAFCQVFTRDPCFVVGDTLFVGSLRDDYRHPEIAGLAPLRTQVLAAVDLSGDGATVEGGDVMVLDGGRRVLVGMNRHTNEAGCGKLANHLARSGVEVIRVPHRALHLDCCLVPLPNGEALYSASKLPASSVDVLRRCFTLLIPLDQEEAEVRLAANVLWISERQVVSNAATPQTNRLLRDKKYEVIELDFSHLVRLWGSFRCVVCPLERA
jgi:N-dimethylarginine dimethylaminohydrolase